jgi:hypothetical protein
MALTDTILKGDDVRIISAKISGDWLSSYREDFYFDEIVIGWFSSKNVSGGSALRSICFFNFNTFRVIFQKR